MTQEKESLVKGRYIARACPSQDVVWRKSPNKGTDGIYVIFTITQGPQSGERVPWGPWYSGNAVDRIFESLRFCGCTFPNDDPMDTTGIDTNEVMIVIEADAMEPGGWRVSFVNEIGAAGGIAMDDSAKEDFRARMKGRLMGGGQQSPSSGDSGVGSGIPF
jgi:hypothetical protein